LPRSDEDRELSLLPAGGSLYLWADTAQSRPLLDVLDFGGFSGRDAAMVLDRTGTAAAVAFAQPAIEAGQEGSPEHDRRFFLAATGRYPRHRANFSFAFTRGWRRHRSPDGGTFWRSQNGVIAVALGSNLALVSNIDPLEGFERVVPPRYFTEFRRGMALAGWMYSPSGPINGFLQSTGIPIQIPAEDFFFGAVRSPVSALDTSPAPWELVFRIRAPSEIHARSLLALFSTARFLFQMGAAAGDEPSPADTLSLQDAAMMLFANVPQQDGESITLRIGPLDENTIALLFGMFSVYSR